MTREEFLINYWEYYKMLENDFLNVCRYIKILPINYKTCSDEIIKLLQTVSSEFEIICKLVCGFKGNSNKKIYDYLSYFYSNIRNFDKTRIKIKIAKNITLKPLKTIMNNNNQMSLEWWKSYNNIKHNRLENYEEGNFLNLLKALAALYFLEIYYIKLLGNQNNELDIPNEESKLFQIVGWKKNPKRGSMILEKDILPNTPFIIPLKYVVGSNTLDVYYNSTKLLLKGKKKNDDGHYVEVGEDGFVSNKIKLVESTARKNSYFEFVVHDNF